MTFRADPADVLTGTFVPTTLLVRDEERGHQTLGSTGRHAHATLAIPVPGASATSSTAAVIATFLTEAVGRTVLRLDAVVAQQLGASRLLRRASAAGIAAVVGTTFLGSAIGEAGGGAGCSATLTGGTGEAGRAGAADIATAIIATLFAQATGLAVFHTFAGVEITL